MDSLDRSVGSLILQRFEVLRVLGRGGAATAYLVRDHLWNGTVALKLLDISSGPVLEAMRFEFEVLRQLQHPHLVQVFEFGLLDPGRLADERVDNDDATQCFYTAVAVQGGSLEDYAKGRSWAELRQPLCDTLAALRLLHSVGIRHGDVKPSNVLIDPTGRAVLIDLSCARPLVVEPAQAALSTPISGTPGFVAPELLAGRAVDARADLFAFGVMLQRLVEQLDGDAPQSVRALIGRLVHQRPERRPADANEVLEALGAEPALIHPLLARLGRLVGRDAELAAARSALESVRANVDGPRVVHVVGAGGSGRTRLLQEIRWQAQQQCAVVEANAASASAIGDLIARAERIRRADPGGPPAATRPEPELEAWHRLSHAGPPLVAIVDDADHLDPGQLRLLVGMARLLHRTGPTLLVIASRPELVLDVDGAERVPLDPLDELDLSRWVGSALSTSTRARLLGASGGHPATIRALLQRIASQQLREEELAQEHGAVELSAQQRATVATLSDHALQALGLLVVAGGAMSGDAVAELGLAEHALGELVTAGLATRGATAWSLLRIAEASALQELLSPSSLATLHAMWAAWLGAQLASVDDTGESTDPTAARGIRSAADEPDRRTESHLASLRANQVRHLALAGQRGQARALLEAHDHLHGMAPAAWARAAETLADQGSKASLQLRAAKLVRQAGRPDQALVRIEALAKSGPTGPIAIELAIERGACHLEQGHAADAVGTLGAIIGQCEGPEQLGRAADLLARALTRQGAYQEAIEHAEAGLAAATAPAQRIDLLTTSAVALSFAGQLPSALERLDEAMESLAEQQEPRRAVRIYGSRALVAYNMGRLPQAMEDYRRALQLAEQQGLTDQLATAALNLGTACHQAGRWHEALRSYERGMRMAVATSQRSTEGLLRFNLSKLYCDLGLFDRADQALQRCSQLMGGTAHGLLTAAIETIHAEIAQGRGQLRRAQDHLERARPGLELHGSEREKAELRIQLAELATATGEPAQATRQLESAEVLLRDTEARDVEARWLLARARLETGDGQSGGIPYAEQAAELAAELGQSDLQAEAARHLATAWAAEGADQLAREHRQLARRLWERTAAALPSNLRDAFWGHPRRAGLEPEPRTADPDAAPAPRSSREHKLERLLDINKRLNSSLRTQQVLERAMDAAIELTGAERGFVLLAEPHAEPSSPADEPAAVDEPLEPEAEQPSPGGGRRPTTRRRRLRVAVARNLDREQLGRSHLKFSRGIAERVMKIGQPLITADAQSDGRLSAEASVHAMHLKSVVCVPVQAPSGVLGALYLDNRFQRGHFTASDLEVLSAFADQVALALTNARLHDELRQRNRELEAERRRVQQLARGQAAEIDRLTEEVERRRIPRPHRFDYSAMVGSSRALDEVLALLDRVIDTSLPILVQGASGTGKELVARAIHHNSPRRAGPLVSVNCAALPDNLLESELFGYERGAFTGAERAREGLVVQARGGTLFLDEIGEMPLGMQVKLLRVLQERQVQPLGAGSTVDVDFRLVCATNRVLRQEVADGRFREDLYYRLSAVEVVLPTLRERADDIPELATHLLARLAEQLGRALPKLGGHALRKLMAYEWPGNVRQLEHVLTKAVALAEGERITAGDIDLPSSTPAADETLSRTAYAEAERDRIVAALHANRWNVAKTARELDIPRPTLYRRLKRYGLAPG